MTSDNHRRSFALCLLVWLLASAGWILLASVPLHRPSEATIRVARTLAPGMRVSLIEGHRIIDTWWPETTLVCLGGIALLVWPRTWSTQATLLRRTSAFLLTHRWLLLILVVALVSRVALAYRGGQYFDWDEHRYSLGPTEVFFALSQAEWRHAVEAVCRPPGEHQGFRLVGVLPALLQTVPASWTGRSIADMHLPSGEWVAAATLSCFSVIVIGEAYWLAAKLGARRPEAVLAAFLTACSTTLFYGSRHLLPYEASLALALAALGVGLNGRGPLRSFSSGVLAGSAFLVYNGYWTLVPVVGLVHGLYRPYSRTDACRRLLLFGVGAGCVPASLIGGAELLGVSVWRDLVRFSRTVTNGDFAAGASLPWQFLWHAEHGILLAWGLGAGLLAWSAVRHVRRRPLPDPTPHGRGWLWLGLAGALYLILAVGANVLHKFAVYDRSVRPLVPFLCLATASAVTIVTPRLPRWLLRLAVLLIAAQTMSNIAPLFAVRFPREVAIWAMRTYGSGEVELGTSLPNSVESTSFFLPPNLPGATGTRRYVLLNAKDIWFDDDRLRARREVPGTVIYRTTHPRQLFLYQYFGYTESLRTWLRQVDFSMQIVDQRASTSR